jgi:hypothetical protein
LSIGHEQYQTSIVSSSSSTQNLPLPPPPPHTSDLNVNVKSDDGVNKSLGSHYVSQGVQSAGEKKRKKEKEPLISGFKNKKMVFRFFL